MVREKSGNKDGERKEWERENGRAKMEGTVREDKKREREGRGKEY